MKMTPPTVSSRDEDEILDGGVEMVSEVDLDTPTVEHKTWCCGNINTGNFPRHIAGILVIK